LVKNIETKIALITALLTNFFILSMKTVILFFGCKAALIQEFPEK